jgi:hypothetical protein
MCKIYQLDDHPMSHKLYDTKERNKAQGTLKNCLQCTPRKQRKCLRVSSKLGKSNPYSPMRPKRFIDTGALRSAPSVPHGQKINGSLYKIETKKVGKKTTFKIIHLIYGRTIDRYAKMIHS